MPYFVAEVTGVLSAIFCFLKLDYLTWRKGPADHLGVGGKEHFRGWSQL